MNRKEGAEMSGPDPYLLEQFEYYIANQDKLVKEYNGKYLVIKDCQVIGAYDTEEEAISVTTREHKLGTFIVQKCEEGSNAYTQTFHSRVVFA